MKKLSLCLCFFFLALAEPNKTIQETTCTNNNSSNLIQETCKTFAKSDPYFKYDFCVASLQPGRCAADLRGLGLLSVKLVRHNVTSTRRHVRDLLKDKRWDPATRMVLKDCFVLYSDPDLNDIVRDYKARRYDYAKEELTGVMTDATTCEDGFHEKPGLVSPLTKRNNDAVQLSSIAMNIMALLHNKVQS